MLVFAALFEKASNPQNYLWQLREFYVATRDFRLLAGMADAVVGHTAGQVYPFLQSMGSVLGEIRDEATADSLIEQLAESARSGEDRNRPTRPRHAGTSGRTPGGRTEEPARPARRKGVSGHAKGLQAAVVGRRAETYGRFPGLLGRDPRRQTGRRTNSAVANAARESAPGSLDRLHIALHWQMPIGIIPSASRPSICCSPRLTNIKTP